MPITRHQKCLAGSWRSSSPAKAPHFFKMVLSDTVKKKMLRIPPKFARKYGKNLSKTIFLKVPSGAEWRIKLKKCNGYFWLEKGWQVFADYYSIVFGHFLVFRYEGNSCFHVLIFDKSACEIKYHGKETITEVHHCEDDDDISVETLNDLPCKRKTALQCQGRRQPCDEDEDVSVEIMDDPQQLASHSQSYGTAAKRVKLETKEFSRGKKVHEKRQAAAATDRVGAREKANSYKSDNHSQSNGIATRSVKLETKELSGGKVLEKRKAAAAAATGKLGPLESANAYKSDNPRFIVTMQPSYVSFNFRLNVPLVFMRKYFTVKNDTNVYLRVDEKTWSAKYRCRSNYSRLCGGWKAFTKHNHLRVGDVCVFELIKDVENSLEVVIFRGH